MVSRYGPGPLKSQDPFKESTAGRRVSEIAPDCPCTFLLHMSRIQDSDYSLLGHFSGLCLQRANLQHLLSNVFLGQRTILLAAGDKMKGLPTSINVTHCMYRNPFRFVSWLWWKQAKQDVLAYYSVTNMKVPFL